MSSFRDAVGGDALTMLSSTALDLDDHLSFELPAAAANGTPAASTGGLDSGGPVRSQQQHAYSTHDRVGLDYLEQLGLEDLLDDDNLFGSPIQSDADLPPAFDVSQPPPPEESGDFDGEDVSQPVAPHLDFNEPPSSSSPSGTVDLSSSEESDDDAEAAASSPAASAFTINPNALSMNPSAMHLVSAAASSVQARPSSPEVSGPQSSPRRSSASPSRHVNAAAGPGPSSQLSRRQRAPVGVVDPSASTTISSTAVSKKRDRSVKASSTSGLRKGRSSSPTKLPSPPPAKRKKLRPPSPGPDDDPGPSAGARGKKRARSNTPTSDIAPLRKKSKGKGREATQKPLEPQTLEEQIARAHRINALKDKLRGISARYDDNRRLIFHLQNFKLLADYNPYSAREDSSTVFKKWVDEYGYDLAKRIPEDQIDDTPPTLGDSARWRTASSRRAMAQQDALQALLEAVPVPSVPVAGPSSPDTTRPAPKASSTLAPLGPRPAKKKTSVCREASKTTASRAPSASARPSALPETRRPSAPIHRLERPLSQPKSGMPLPNAKPWHSTKSPPMGPPPPKKAKAKKALPVMEGPTFVHRPDGSDVPIGAVWGGSTVWNPAAPREAFCILDDADLIEDEDEDEETQRDREELRERELRRKREEAEAERERTMKKEAAFAKRAPPPKKVVSKLSQVVAKKKDDLQAQQDKDKSLEKAKARLSTSVQAKRPGAPTGPSRLPPPQHVSRLPPTQVSYRSKFKHTAYSDSDDGSSDEAGSSRPKSRPKPRPRLSTAKVHQQAGPSNQAGGPSPPKAIKPAEIISIDSDSDSSHGGGMDHQPPAPPIGGLPSICLPAASISAGPTSARQTVSGKSPAAALPPAEPAAQPVRLKLNLKGKTIASFTSVLTPDSSIVWDRLSPVISPPLSPIITAANLPPHWPVAYPRYTDEGQLRDFTEENLPGLTDYLQSLATAPPREVDPNVVCLDDDDAGDAAVRWEASVRERVAAARSFGRLDGGGLELQGEHEDNEELFSEQQIAYLPRSGGFLPQHDLMLRDVHRFQRSVVALSKYHRRLATRIAEMIEEHWARQEGRDAKSLKELEKARKAGARKLSKEVRARWALAVDLVHTKHRAAEDEEERRRNHEQLNELLERSQVLLADRRADLAGPSASPEPVSVNGAALTESSEAESEDEMEQYRRSLFLSPPPASPSLEEDEAPPPPALPPPLAPHTRPEHQVEPIVLGDSSDDDSDEIQVISSFSDDDDIQIVEPAVASPPRTAPPVAPNLELPRQPSTTVRPAPVASSPTEATGRAPPPDQKPIVGLVESKNVAVPLSASGAAPASPAKSTSTSSFDAAPPGSESEMGDLLELDGKTVRSPRVMRPSLLRGELRPYQQDGLEWLVSLFNNGTNGILADEMGLGKTIQTIALLAHLACEKGLWGPHLIIVPTSVLLNWDMEFKKFLPGFNVLPYHGSKKDREQMRRGWDAEGAFEVCITSYQLAVADSKIFKRKQWGYMVLDEAHNIKNFQSKKWTTLLGFNADRRLLLTGTPLQNNLQELWSLLYFLMPSEAELDDTAFANHKTFNEWFSTPLEKAIEAGDASEAGPKGVVDKLHTILRPYVLRRLKADVEKQLPAKREHVVYCRLSKRQRYLYDEFMSRAETRDKLASGNFLSISNCLMQLRKVCNHPDLFETRPIRTSFVLLDRAVAVDYEIKDFLIRRRLVLRESASAVNLSLFDLHPSTSFGTRNDGLSFLDQPRTSPTTAALLDASERVECMFIPPETPVPANTRTIAGWKAYDAKRKADAAALWCRLLAPFNNYKCQSGAIPQAQPLGLLQQLGFGDKLTPLDNLVPASRVPAWAVGNLLQGAVQSYASRAAQHASMIRQFSVIPPAVVARDVTRLALAGLDQDELPALADPAFDSLHQSAVAHQIAFPDASLIQYDCGKLQVLFDMFRKLKSGGHRVLLFTQMTRVLDILEIFLNLHGHRYLRLDGSTRTEDRQMIMEKFNADDKIFCLIATTRSGGVGLNLTGADVVVQYDSDWNPAMDKQAQDRAHRIGQTREVNIYRLVSEHTVEENMLKKANQKRQLDDLVMQDGEFTTDFFSKLDWRDALNDFVEEALAAEPLSQTADSRKSLAAGPAPWDTAAGKDALEDEEMRELMEAAKDASRFNEDDFEAEADGADQASQQHRSAAPDVGRLAEDDDDGLEGVERLMVRWVEADWEFFG